MAADTQYVRLQRACEDNNTVVTHTYLGRDDLGKPRYTVSINGRRLETVETWSNEPGYEALAIMLMMASEMRDDKEWCAAHHIPFDTDGYFNDHERVYARLRWVLTDAQIVDYTALAYDDQHAYYSH